MGRPMRRWRVSGKIVSVLDEYEVEAPDMEEAQRKAEADADNFAEWEEGPEIEEVFEEWGDSDEGAA